MTPERHTDFEQLYISNFGRLKRFACAYDIPEEEAENIIQDIFLNVWQKNIFTHDKHDISMYLFAAVKNRCIDFLRHQLTHAEVLKDMQEEHELSMKLKFLSLQEFDEKDVDIDQLGETIAKALAALPDKCRTIFVMSKIDGKKQRQIAQELGISLNTVETQMGIAYKKLRAELKDALPMFITLLNFYSFITH